MVKGYEKNQARLQALSLLGKDLARRARSHCELCGTSGVRFKTREVEPVPEEPELAHCLLVCENCDLELDRRGGFEPAYWRFLETSAWSEEPAVQVCAVRVLRALDEPWAQDLLEQLYLWPESERWLAASG